MGTGFHRRQGSGAAWLRAAACAVLAVGSLARGQAHAMELPVLNGDGKAALAACQDQRESLLELQRQYGEVRKGRLMAAAAAGAKVGFSVLMAGTGLGLGAGLLKSGLTAGGMAQAAAGGGKEQDSGDVAALTASVVAITGGAADAYVKIKEQQLGPDGARIARAVDADAAAQAPISLRTGLAIKGLADCRSAQVSDFQARLAAAGEKARKQAAREQGSLKSALKNDIDLADDVVNQQAVMVKTFTQGRAMAEGKSEADILAGDTPAYGGPASATALALPAADPRAPAPAKIGYVTVKSTAVRAAPDAKAAVVMTFPPGRSVTPKGHAAQDPSWWEIDLGGSPGFVRGSDLAEPGSMPAAPAPRKGGKAHAAAPALTPAGAAGVRALNKAVLAARSDGVERLKALGATL